MDYIPPLGEAANSAYIDGNPATGTEGSTIPAASLEHPQREIVAAIIAAGLTPDENDLTQLAQAIALLAPTPPAQTAHNVGDFFYHVGTVAPAGALVLDGTTGLLRSTYQALFDHLNTAGLVETEGSKQSHEFGNGDGATTFSLADWRDEFIRISSASRTVGSWQDDEFKSHTHSFNRQIAPTHSTSSLGASPDEAYSDESSLSSEGSLSVNTTGGSETRPRNIALLGCIQYL